MKDQIARHSELIVSSAIVICLPVPGPLETQFRTQLDRAASQCPHVIEFSEYRVAKPVRWPFLSLRKSLRSERKSCGESSFCRKLTTAYSGAVQRCSPARQVAGVVPVSGWIRPPAAGTSLSYIYQDSVAI